MRHINTIWRHSHALDSQIRSGEPELAAQSIAFHNFSGQRIRPSKQCTHFVEMTCANLAANSSAADRLTVKVHRGDCFNLKPQFMAQVLQKLDSALSAMTKSEFLPNQHNSEPGEVSERIANKLLGAFFAERPVEMNQPCRVNAQIGKAAQSLVQSLDCRWSMMRGNDAGRVPIESRHESQRALVFRAGYGPAYHGLMPEMKPVEHADGHAQRLRRQFPFSCLCDDVHRGSELSAARRIHSSRFRQFQKRDHVALEFGRR